MSQTGKLPGFEFQKDICDKFSSCPLLWEAYVMAIMQNMVCQPVVFKPLRSCDRTTVGLRDSNKPTYAASTRNAA